MKTVKMIVSKDFKFAKASEILFSSFVEQMGSVVYNGIFELGHPTSDENGFRRDALENNDIKAVNREENLNLVVPNHRGNALLKDGLLLMNLPKMSWNV